MSARSIHKREGEAPTKPETYGSNLPEGWASVALKDLPAPSRPRRDPQEFSNLRYVGMEQIVSHTRRLLGTSDAAEMKSTAFHFQPNDVLYGRLRPYLNKVWQADCEGLCSSEFIVLPPTVAFEPSYLSCFLSTDEFVEFANHLNQGDRPRVSFDQIGDFQIPLPPLAEQRRIVAKLELLLGKVTSSRQRLSRVPGLLKRFRQSVLAAACSGKLTADWREENEPDSAARRWNLKTEPFNSEELPELPPTWVWRKIDDISERVSVGHVGPTKQFYCSSDIGIPFVRSQNVRPARLTMDDSQYITHEFHNSLKKSQLRAGDILIVRVGANRGDTCKVPDAIGVLNCANIVFARPFPGISDYIEHYCQSKLGQDLLLGMTTGSAQGVLNTTAVAELPIAIPPSSRATRNRASSRKAVCFRGPDRVTFEAGTNARRPPHAVAPCQSFSWRTGSTKPK